LESGEAGQARSAYSHVAIVGSIKPVMPATREGGATCIAGMTRRELLRLTPFVTSFLDPKTPEITPFRRRFGVSPRAVHPAIRHEASVP